MKIPKQLDRSTIVVGGSFLCVAIFLFYAIGSLWLMRSGYSEEIDRIDSRTARILGLIEAEKDLSAAASQLRSHLRDMAYADNTTTATVSAAMQQLVRDVMTSAGLSVTSSQILAARQIDGLERLSLDISVAGNIGGVEEAVANLGLLNPLVLIESTSVKPSPMTVARWSVIAGRRWPASIKHWPVCFRCAGDNHGNHVFESS